MFDPQTVFELLLENQIEEAIRINENARLDFENRKRSWLMDASILRAIGKPLPPKPVPGFQRTVLANRDALTVTLGIGGLVAYPDFDLPPVPPVNVPGTVDIGGPIPGNPGLFWRGPTDESAWNAVAEKDGKTYRRGGGFIGRGWWELVV